MHTYTRRTTRNYPGLHTQVHTRTYIADPAFHCASLLLGSQYLAVGFGQFAIRTLAPIKRRLGLDTRLLLDQAPVGGGGNPGSEPTSFLTSHLDECLVTGFRSPVANANHLLSTLVLSQAVEERSCHCLSSCSFYRRHGHGGTIWQ